MSRRERFPRLAPQQPDRYPSPWPGMLIVVTFCVGVLTIFHQAYLIGRAVVIAIIGGSP
jgi:hypothetical protein